jgi:1-deoxy-D-xylulose-5-phosphate synthase
MATSQLEARGFGVTLADARFAKPLDTSMIKQLVRHHKSLVLVEQGARGGFGAMVFHYLAEQGLLGWRCQVRSMTLPDQFIDQASPSAMYEQAGMTSDDIVREALAGL